MDSEQNDERFAWKTALVIMLFLSCLTVALRLLESLPFQDTFAISLVGIPTVVLLIGWLKIRRGEGENL